MCKCVFTTEDILNQINQKRVKNNLVPMNYDVVMVHYRTIFKKFPPDSAVGNNYVFRKGKTQKIVSHIWNKKYRPLPQIDWFSWKKAV